MINQEMLTLAEQMVQIPSINTTEGEKEIGLFIEKYIRSLPYYQKHPELVRIQELQGDSLQRRNVFALLLGEKEHKKDTLLLHGHTDTVGLEGFGKLASLACKPRELAEEMKKMELAKEVKEDLLSGDYMFGRGACDMKSGDAVFLGLLKEYSEHPEKLSGNILVSLNPVEENLHTGVIEGLDVLEEWKEKYDLSYICAINNDYICPLYQGDQVKTIYTGVVGKLLPCFYIQGKETHVGQCYEGFDATMIAASLSQKINMSHKFADSYEGEVTYPPSTLKMKDLKPWYNVQTAAEAFVYFNYFVHNASIEEITNKLVKTAKEVLQEVNEKINMERKWFCEASHQNYEPYEYEMQSLTYEDLYEKALWKNKNVEKRVQEIMKQEMEAGVDKREVPIAVIRFLLGVAEITTPTVVLYYAAPYCPHNTLKGKDNKLIDEMKQIAEEVTMETGDQYRFMRFFPSLSDSSYLRIDDDQESVNLLLNNFPGFVQLYPIPIDKIQRINIPTVNYGCYGKDAHKWTERVHIPYTFGTLPTLLRKTINYYLG